MLQCLPQPRASSLPLPLPPGSHRDVGRQMCAALFDPTTNEAIDLPNFALRSGPRRTIYHDPKNVTAAIVTCAFGSAPACVLAACR